MTAPLTTAAALLDFHRELTEGGILEQTADHLAAIALGEILQGGGLCVREAVSA